MACQTLYEWDHPPIAATTIKRRMLKFFRFHHIPHQQQAGLVYLGNGICQFLNGCIHFHFPKISKEYSQHVTFTVHFTDTWNTYLKLAQMHNRVVGAFPKAGTIYLPDLFD